MRKLFVLFFCTLMLVSLNAFATEQRLISVVGTAEKTFQPDIVYINVLLWGKGDSAKKAQSNNQSEYEVLKKSLETFKVKKEDAKTTSYNLNPEYSYDQKTNRNTIIGYNAAQEIQIKLKKIEDAGPFIDSLTSSSKALMSGVNVNSLFFDLEKRDEEARALLSLAVVAAQRQAEVLAKAADVKLKGLFRLAPVIDGQKPAPMYRKEMAMMASDRGGSTQMLSGEVKVNAQVSADYMIE